MLRKNQKQVFARVLIMATIAVLAVGIALPVLCSSAAAVTPPHSKAFGKTLAEWLTIYWERTMTGGEDKVGQVQLLPLPDSVWTGTGTEEDPVVATGVLEITLEPGTPFVVPLFAWIGERYEGYPDVPDDEPFDEDEFLGWFQPNLTVDGKTIVSDENKAAFYVPPTSFDAPIMYDEPTGYGAIGAIWFQGIGIVSQPLSVGEHVIHLLEPVPAFGFTYDNTWIITVAPKSK